MIRCRWSILSEAVQSVVRDTAEDSQDLYTQTDRLDNVNAIYVDGKKIESVAQSWDLLLSKVELFNDIVAVISEVRS